MNSTRRVFFVLSIQALVSLPFTNLAHAELRQQIFAEAFGPAFTGSLNYEMQPVRGLALRAGAGIVPLCMSTSPCRVFVAAPIGVSYFGLPGNHHYEVGAGASFLVAADDDARFFSPSIGYRYQRPEGGMTFRVNATPLFRMNKPSDVLPWMGASLGYTF